MDAVTRLAQNSIYSIEFLFEYCKDEIAYSNLKTAAYCLGMKQSALRAIVLTGQMGSLQERQILCVIAHRMKNKKGRGVVNPSFWYKQKLL